MQRQLRRTAIALLLFNISLLQLNSRVFASSPAVEDVLRILEMNGPQISELAEGRPVLYNVSENGTDELASGIAWYLPIPLSKVVAQLRIFKPDLLDVDVKAYGILTVNSKAESLPTGVLSSEDTEALLDVESGSEFNLSSQEIDSFKSLKKALNQNSSLPIRDSVAQRYREILFERFNAYRHGGTDAIAPYARDDKANSDPASELRLASNSSAILANYFPNLYKVWMNYPQTLPTGATEIFPWISKIVENRQGVILRHRINVDWNDGLLVLTREFYAPHSYNSSQWLTGCLPYRNGTVIFQQVRSYTDQVAGMASNVKHIIGRKVLKEKMLKSFERLCKVLDQCH